MTSPQSRVNFIAHIGTGKTGFTASAKVAPAFNAVADRVQLEIVAYLRRQDRWAVSAYKQWGIKHKTYEGPVQPFTKWFNPEECDYLTVLNRWHSLVPFADYKV